MDHFRDDLRLAYPPPPANPLVHRCLLSSTCTRINCPHQSNSDDEDYAVVKPKFTPVRNLAVLLAYPPVEGLRTAETWNVIYVFAKKEKLFTTPLDIQTAIKLILPHLTTHLYFDPNTLFSHTPFAVLDLAMKSDQTGLWFRHPPLLYTFITTLYHVSPVYLPFGPTIVEQLFDSYATFEAVQLEKVLPPDLRDLIKYLPHTVTPYHLKNVPDPDDLDFYRDAGEKRIGAIHSWSMQSLTHRNYDLFSILELNLGQTPHLTPNAVGQHRQNTYNLEHFPTYGHAGSALHYNHLPGSSPNPYSTHLPLDGQGGFDNEILEFGYLVELAYLRKLTLEGKVIGQQALFLLSQHPQSNLTPIPNPAASVGDRDRDRDRPDAGAGPWNGARAMAMAASMAELGMTTRSPKQQQPPPTTPTMGLLAPQLLTTHPSGADVIHQHDSTLLNLHNKHDPSQTTQSNLHNPLQTSNLASPSPVPSQPRQLCQQPSQQPSQHSTQQPSQQSTNQSGQPDFSPSLPLPLPLPLEIPRTRSDPATDMTDGTHLTLHHNTHLPSTSHTNPSNLQLDSHHHDHLTSNTPTSNTPSSHHLPPSSNHTMQTNLTSFHAHKPPSAPTTELTTTTDPTTTTTTTTTATTTTTTPMTSFHSHLHPSSEMASRHLFYHPHQSHQPHQPTYNHLHPIGRNNIDDDDTPTLTTTSPPASIASRSSFAHQHHHESIDDAKNIPKGGQNGQHGHYFDEMQGSHKSGHKSGQNGPNGQQNTKLTPHSFHIHRSTNSPVIATLDSAFPPSGAAPAPTQSPAPAPITYTPYSPHLSPQSPFQHPLSPLSPQSPQSPQPRPEPAYNPQSMVALGKYNRETPLSPLKLGNGSNPNHRIDALLSSADAQTMQDHTTTATTSTFDNDNNNNHHANNTAIRSTAPLHPYGSNSPPQSPAQPNSTLNPPSRLLELLNRPLPNVPMIMLDDPRHPHYVPPSLFSTSSPQVSSTTSTSTSTITPTFTSHQHDPSHPAPFSPARPTFVASLLEPTHSTHTMGEGCTHGNNSQYEQSDQKGTDSPLATPLRLASANLPKLQHSPSHPYLASRGTPTNPTTPTTTLNTTNLHITLPQPSFSPPPPPATTQLSNPSQTPSTFPPISKNTLTTFQNNQKAPTAPLFPTLPPATPNPFHAHTHTHTSTSPHTPALYIPQSSLTFTQLNTSNYHHYIQRLQLLISFGAHLHPALLPHRFAHLFALIEWLADLTLEHYETYKLIAAEAASAASATPSSAAAGTTAGGAGVPATGDVNGTGNIPPPMQQAGLSGSNNNASTGVLTTNMSMANATITTSTSLSRRPSTTSTHTHPHSAPHTLDTLSFTNATTLSTTSTSANPALAHALHPPRFTAPKSLELLISSLFRFQPFKTFTVTPMSLKVALIYALHRHPLPTPLLPTYPISLSSRGGTSNPAPHTSSFSPHPRPHNGPHNSPPSKQRSHNHNHNNTYHKTYQIVTELHPSSNTSFFLVPPTLSFHAHTHTHVHAPHNNPALLSANTTTTPAKSALRSSLSSASPVATMFTAASSSSLHTHHPSLTDSQTTAPTLKLLGEDSPIGSPVPPHHLHHYCHSTTFPPIQLTTNLLNPPRPNNNNNNNNQNNNNEANPVLDHNGPHNAQNDPHNGNGNGNANGNADGLEQHLTIPLNHTIRDPRNPKKSMSVFLGTASPVPVQASYGDVKWHLCDLLTSSNLLTRLVLPLLPATYPAIPFGDLLTIIASTCHFAQFDNVFLGGTIPFSPIGQPHGLTGPLCGPIPTDDVLSTGFNAKNDQNGPTSTQSMSMNTATTTTASPPKPPKFGLLNALLQSSCRKVTPGRPRISTMLTYCVKVSDLFRALLLRFYPSSSTAPTHVGNSNHTYTRNRVYTASNHYNNGTPLASFTFKPRINPTGSSNNPDAQLITTYDATHAVLHPDNPLHRPSLAPSPHATFAPLVLKSGQSGFKTSLMTSLETAFGNGPVNERLKDHLESKNNPSDARNDKSGKTGQTGPTRCPPRQFSYEYGALDQYSSIDPSFLELIQTTLADDRDHQNKADIMAMRAHSMPKMPTQKLAQLFNALKADPVALKRFNFTTPVLTEPAMVISSDLSLVLRYFGAHHDGSYVDESDSEADNDEPSQPHPNSHDLDHFAPTSTLLSHQKLSMASIDDPFGLNVGQRGQGQNDVQAIQACGLETMTDEMGAGGFLAQFPGMSQNHDTDQPSEMTLPVKGRAPQRKNNRNTLAPTSTSTFTFASTADNNTNNPSLSSFDYNSLGNRHESNNATLTTTTTTTTTTPAPNTMNDLPDNHSPPIQEQPLPTYAKWDRNWAIGFDIELDSDEMDESDCNGSSDDESDREESLDHYNNGLPNGPFSSFRFAPKSTKNANRRGKGKNGHGHSGKLQPKATPPNKYTMPIELLVKMIHLPNLFDPLKFAIFNAPTIPRPTAVVTASTANTATSTSIPSLSTSAAPMPALSTTPANHHLPPLFTSPAGPSDSSSTQFVYKNPTFQAEAYPDLFPPQLNQFSLPTFQPHLLLLDILSPMIPELTLELYKMQTADTTTNQSDVQWNQTRETHQSKLRTATRWQKVTPHDLVRQIRHLSDLQFYLLRRLIDTKCFSHLLDLFCGYTSNIGAKSVHPTSLRIHPNTNQPIFPFHWSVTTPADSFHPDLSPHRDLPQPTSSNYFIMLLQLVHNGLTIIANQYTYNYPAHSLVGVQNSSAHDQLLHYRGSNASYALSPSGPSPQRTPSTTRMNVHQCYHITTSDHSTSIDDHNNSVHHLSHHHRFLIKRPTVSTSTSLASSTTTPVTTITNAFKCSPSDLRYLALFSTPPPSTSPSDSSLYIPPNPFDHFQHTLTTTSTASISMINSPTTMHDHPDAMGPYNHQQHDQHQIQLQLTHLWRQCAIDVYSSRFLSQLMLFSPLLSYFSPAQPHSPMATLFHAPTPQPTISPSIVIPSNPHNSDNDNTTMSLSSPPSHPSPPRCPPVSQLHLPFHQPWLNGILFFLLGTLTTTYIREVSVFWRRFHAKTATPAAMAMEAPNPLLTFLPPHLAIDTSTISLSTPTPAHALPFSNTITNNYTTSTTRSVLTSKDVLHLHSIFHPSPPPGLIRAMAGQHSPHHLSPHHHHHHPVAHHHHNHTHHEHDNNNFDNNNLSTSDNNEFDWDFLPPFPALSSGCFDSQLNPHAPAAIETVLDLIVTAMLMESAGAAHGDDHH